MPCVTYAIDGVPLDDRDGRWSLRATTEVGPALSTRAVDNSLPGMDGIMPVGYEPIDSPSQLFKIGVYGNDATEALRNYSAVLMLVVGEHELTKTVGTHTTRTRMLGKTTTAPEFFPAGHRLTFTAEVRLPEVYWRDDVSDWVNQSPVSGISYRVTTLDGSTGPIDDALVLIEGPSSNPIRVASDDAWFQVSLALPAGQAALVDCRNWTVRVGAGVTFAGGGDVKTGALTTSGGPYLLRLRPSILATDPQMTQVAITPTFASGSPKLSIRAARSFLA